MNKFKIYLCGGMTGLTDEEQKGWRMKFMTSMDCATDNVDYFDPTAYYTYHYFKDAQDAEELSMKFDLRNLVSSDLVVCNISSNPYSVGTNMELGMAHNMQIPVVIYNPLDVLLHPWHKAVSDGVFTDMETLIDFITDYYI